MGKSKKKAKVPYYYMSLHYGICHGPLQSINQIAVRDKPIFCGEMAENGVIYVNMPELFGGQTAEGGVYGAVECYLGTGDQKMTQFAAKRFGKTSDSMLGYRGLANIFFRGPDETEELQVPPPTTGKAPNSSATIFDETVYEYFFGERPPDSDFDPEGGFHWSVNNPYMPSAWVHVTRCPTPLGEQWAYVLHPPSGELFDWAIASVPVFAGGPWGDDQDERLTVYLDEIAPQVDAGHVVFTAKYTTLFSSNGTSSSVTVQGQQQIWARAYDEDGSPMNWADTSDRSETTPYWIGGVLRQQMGFRGVVFSDDIGMAASHSAGGVPARVHAHLDAGCDVVLVCHPELVDDALQAVQGRTLKTAALLGLIGRGGLGWDGLLADMALLPFVRQFAQVDRAWFDATPALPALRAWLQRGLDLPLFANVMAKPERSAQG